MYDKTSSANYFKYGGVNNSKEKYKDLIKTKIIIEEKVTDEFVSYDKDVYVELIEGMAVLIILDNNEYKLFAIHRSVKINSGYYFSILPMSNVALYNLYMPENTNKDIIEIDKPFVFKNISNSIIVKEIMALYYSVKSPRYKFDGEIHPYFELTYVDNGSLVTEVDNKKYELNKNECLIYYPAQFHTQEITSNETCSYITIIFECVGISKEKMFNKVYNCSREMVSIIEQIAKNGDIQGDIRNELLITYLQLFLVKLVQYDNLKVISNPTTLINQHFEDQLLEEVLTYIQSHLKEPLPIDQICNNFYISRSSLQNLFKNNLGISPKHYINEQKLSLSRVLIKKGEYTISEISNKLGFTSIHYFSRKFTKRFGVAPSEYARKIYE